MSEQLTHCDFEDLLNKNVVLKINGETLTAKVKEVNVSQRHGDAQREPFSVLLVTASEHNHGQAIYSMQHDALGEIDLFLVPLGPKSGGMSYEAVFT